jgi:hypothetical protein
MPHAFKANPDHPAVNHLVRLRADLGGQIEANKIETERLADAMRHAEASAAVGRLKPLSAIVVCPGGDSVQTMTSEIENIIAKLEQTVRAIASASGPDVARLAGYAKDEARKAHLHDVAETAAEVELEANKTVMSLQPSIRHLAEALSRVNHDDKPVV